MKKSAKKQIFVMHKHAASHVHYDFRLEIDGVLASWAVPKGPSTNPIEKHLAIPTDDHPLDYATFEGVIPDGNYGAGAVMRWDYGTYRNIKKKDGLLVPMGQCLKKGRIEVWLDGKKLRGGYALIRTQTQGKEMWLLLKMNDEHADKRRNVVKEDTSAWSGKTMQEIAAQERGDGKKESKKKPIKSTKKPEQKNSIKFGRISVVLTHEDKILFPADGITKGDLIHYYREIASYIVPFMKKHPLTMQRFPDGIKHEGFYHKDIADYFPDWIDRVTVPKREGGTSTYVVCNNEASLVYLVNQACITPHLWLSRTDKLDFPDRMIFDLDPGAATDFARVRTTARALHDLLEELGLASFAMTTGSKGMHVVVPLDRKADFGAVRACARQVADLLVDREGEKYLTTEVRLNKRRGRLFIDTNRNAFAQTVVAPYAVRPLSGAPVATPVTWDEVKKGKLTAQSYTIKNICKRLISVDDVWHEMFRQVYSLKKAQKIIIGKLKIANKGY